jgi:hypothetical protein
VNFVERILKMSKTYVMKAANLYKIGKSNAPHARLKSFQTSNPDIKLLLVCDEEKMPEKKLHSMFKHRKHKNEWFKLTDDDLSVLSNFMTKPNEPTEKVYSNQAEGNVSLSLFIKKDVRDKLQSASFMTKTPQSHIAEEAISSYIDSLSINLPERQDIEDE